MDFANNKTTRQQKNKITEQQKTTETMLDIRTLSTGKNGMKMTKAESVFLELLQIALGNRSRLSEPCSDAEWEEVYSTVKKQAMVGITFYVVDPTRRCRSWTENRETRRYATNAR